jgi:hypothetical protein
MLRPLIQVIRGRPTIAIGCDRGYAEEKEYETTVGVDRADMALHRFTFTLESPSEKS